MVFHVQGHGGEGAEGFEAGHRVDFGFGVYQCWEPRNIERDGEDGRPERSVV
jgi:hypothetical protein